MERKAFTVNIPSETYTKRLIILAFLRGKQWINSQQQGYTCEKELVDAPYVKEFPLVYRMQGYLKIVEIGLHTEFIGEILDVKAHSIVLNEKNLPDIEKVKPILWNPAGMTYHKVGKSLGQAFAIGKEI